MSDPNPTPKPADPPSEPAADAEWSALAESLAAERQGERANGAGPPPPAAPPAGAGRAVFASSLALLLSFIGIAVAGMLWWQYRQFYVSLDQTDTAAAAALERVRAEQRALQDGLQDVNDDVTTVRQLASGVGDRVDSMPSRFADLERRLDAVQGGSFDARGDLLRSEAEYYLTIANTELTLAGNWENAATALELADGRLAELADPRFAPVREAIAAELQAVEAVRLPDVEGLIFSLGRLADRVDDLPLRADLPTNFADRKESLDEAEPGIDRLWLALKRTLLGLIRVERRDAPVEPALSAAERLLSRRQLELELELAKAAVLRGQQEVFRGSLSSASDLLRRDFAADSAEVEGALALLRDMGELELQPPRPDISGSLSLLRTLKAGGN